MEVMEFMDFLEDTKKEFRERLKGYERETKGLADWLLSKFQECTSTFEEEVFVANMKEIVAEQ